MKPSIPDLALSSGPHNFTVGLIIFIRMKLPKNEDSSVHTH